MKQDKNTKAKKEMQKALERFFKDKSGVKAFSLCMQESNQWLQKRIK